MIQEEWIKDWCKKEGFNFVNVDNTNGRLPCSLDKNYKKDNQTFFIKGFHEGSKSIGYSRGGLKAHLSLRVPIDEWTIEAVKKDILPLNCICPRCNKKNLNLGTDDNHKTYVCPECYKDKEVKNAKK